MLLFFSITKSTAFRKDTVVGMSLKKLATIRMLLVIRCECFDFLG